MVHKGVYIMKIHTKIEYINSETGEIFTYQQIKHHKYIILQKIQTQNRNFIHTQYVIKFLSFQTKLFKL